MSSEPEVLAALDRANPVPDPDAITVEPDARRYLAELVNEGVMRGNGHKSSHRQRWIAPVVAAAAVAMLLLGLIAVSGGDANAPVTTTPEAPEGTVADPVPAETEWAFGHWIFRLHPDMWPALFDDVDSPQQATEQDRLRTRWYERFEEECSHIEMWKLEVGERCGKTVPAPLIHSENFAELERRLDEAGWTETTPQSTSFSEYSDCRAPFERSVSQQYFDKYPSFTGLERARFGAGASRLRDATSLRAGLPNSRLSPAQAEIIGDQIVDLIDCNEQELSTMFPNAAEPVQIEELPSSIPARGVIIGDSYAIFAVTTPRGGLAWMELSGAVTVDLVTELATITSEFLDEVIE